MKKKYIIIFVAVVVILVVIIVFLIFYFGKSEQEPEVKINNLSSGGSDLPKVTINCGFTPSSPYFNDVNATVTRNIADKGNVSVSDCRKMVKKAAKIAPFGRSRRLVIDEVSRCLCK